ncbi:MAG: MoaD/ThiS family protein [Candidatus Thermoplasmatota archaeon]
MKIIVKVIGRYTDIVGKSELVLDMSDDSCIWDIINRMISLFPKFDQDKKFMMVLKNNVFARREEKLIDGDEITLVPPVVSGG